MKEEKKEATGVNFQEELSRQIKHTNEYLEKLTQLGIDFQTRHLRLKVQLNK